MRYLEKSLVLASLFVVFLVSCSKPDQPFHFEVLLEDSGDLQTNSPVLAGEETLGKVVALEHIDEGVVVTLELGPDYRGRLSRNAGFEVISGPGGGHLNISDAFGSPAIEDGSRIDARPDWLERLSRSLEDWKGTTRGLLQEAGTALQEFTQDIRQSPEVQALVDSIEEFGSDLATVTKDRYQSFLNQELPKLEEQARQHRQKLIEQGREKEAEIFWKWFERWANAMRNGAPSGPAEAEEPPSSGR